jgi:hypothetical protein
MAMPMFLSRHDCVESRLSLSQTPSEVRRRRLQDGYRAEPGMNGILILVALGSDLTSLSISTSQHALALHRSMSRRQTMASRSSEQSSMLSGSSSE